MKIIALKIYRMEDYWQENYCFRNFQIGKYLANWFSEISVVKQNITRMSRLKFHVFRRYPKIHLDNLASFLKNNFIEIRGSKRSNITRIKLKAIPASESMVIIVIFRALGIIMPHHTRNSQPLPRFSASYKLLFQDFSEIGG